jgi:hypothetical protein
MRPMTNPTDRSGKSPHAFMAEALGVQARLVEQRRAFVSAACAAEDQTLASDRGYPAADVDAYFEALAAETKSVRPRLHTWRR